MHTYKEKIPIAIFPPTCLLQCTFSPKSPYCDRILKGERSYVFSVTGITAYYAGELSFVLVLFRQVYSAPYARKRVEAELQW